MPVPGQVTPPFITSELDVLGRLDRGLERLGIEYMLTGSFAMAHYTVPRMTRDMDLVVALNAQDVAALVSEFEAEFYVDADMAAAAIRTGGMFNLMHSGSAIKVDMIVRKATPYRLVEFERRRRVAYGPGRVWIVSREDLILSKLDWSRASGSEM